MIVNIVLGLGSNAGNRNNYINKTIKEICLTEGFNFIAISAVYKTEPWGYKKQNEFLNCVLVCLCRLNPTEAFRKVKNIEKKIGRVKREKWREREIDIDILFYGEKSIILNELIIPHPQIENRNFILQPLMELMPGFVHPVLHKSIETIQSITTDNGKAAILNNN